MERNLINFACVLAGILGCIHPNNAYIVSNCAENGIGSIHCYCNSSSGMDCPMQVPAYIEKDAVKKISLSGQFDKIQSIIFIKYRNLHSLNASNSRIRNVDFTNQSRLNQVDLSFNVIKELLAKAFIGLRKLKELDLSHNGIEIINRNAFDGVNKLEILNLGHNKIKRFEINNMNRLTVLFLNNNLLEHYNTIENISSLKQLDYSNNPIKYANMDNVPFANLTNLRTIILKSTNLNDANDEIFETLSNKPNLEYIDISENDWECTHLHRILEKFGNLNVSETIICTNKTILIKIEQGASNIVQNASIISNTPRSVIIETTLAKVERKEPKVEQISSSSMNSNMNVWPIIGLLTVGLLILVGCRYAILRFRKGPSSQYQQAPNE